MCNPFVWVQITFWFQVLIFYVHCKKWISDKITLQTSKFKKYQRCISNRFVQQLWRKIILKYIAFFSFVAYSTSKGVSRKICVARENSNFSCMALIQSPSVPTMVFSQQCFSTCRSECGYSRLYFGRLMNENFKSLEQTLDKIPLNIGLGKHFNSNVCFMIANVLIEEPFGPNPPCIATNWTEGCWFL